jgi:hypothetical protein
MKKLIKKSLALFALVALAAGSFGAWGGSAKAATTWDLSGSGDIVMEFEGSDYTHNVSLTQDAEGNLDGTGSSGAYTWDITSGSIEGDEFFFDANYTATADAVTPQTVLHVEGTVNGDGSITGTWSDNYQGGDRSGALSAAAGFAEEISVYVTTNAATEVSSSGATLNGLSGSSAGIGHSFWASTSPFSTDSPVLPAGVYSTPDLGPIAADTAFSAALSSVSGLPAITADTTYYFAAWVNVDGTWYPGEVLSFVTEDVTPETVKVTIVKYVDGDVATAESAGSTDFLMNASWDAENIGAGSGQFSLSEAGFNNPTPYYATTADMTAGADYSVSEVSDSDIVGTACVEGGAPYALGGYTYGNSLAEAEGMELSDVSPAFTDLTSDKYVIIWNDDCATPEDAEGEIGGEVIGGEGELAVTSVETLDGTAIADNTYENGWKFRFNITVPTDENGVAMKFANWDIDGVATDSIATANNMRISSAQAVSETPVTVTGADTYTIPDLDINEDLNPSLDGLQIQVLVEVKIPAGTTNGSYTTSYGVRSQ